ncbi:MAG TPA: bifunctional precorrin-2 dehydrogenase/sirohydrochlorin ferrochelatase [Terriglobales bacterium]|nr:bifunctional precorrin-2 dehydrogenase/sirohydrochlorin ferrochelatase [Terriglobales bacterium]
MSAAPLFPMFLKLEGRPCLVAGAGSIAEAKISSLIDCKAQVHVVAPSASTAVTEAASRGALAWSQRNFELSDLDGVFLVVAATSSQEVNHAIYRAARARGILCNVVDDPQHCDFFYPAVFRRGHFQIAISTGGLSPALAQRVRKQLEEEFPPVYGVWLEELGRKRAELFQSACEPERRRTLLHQSVTPEAFAEFEHDRLTAGVTGVSPLQPGGDAWLSISTTGKDLL